MILRLVVGLLLFSKLVFGQKNVCLFSNKSGNDEAKELLIEKAKLFNVSLVEVKSLDNLNEYTAIFFLDFDESKLSVKENSALVSFFKNGGGAVGFFDIQARNSKRIWFEQMFGKVESQVFEKKDLDLIPVQDLGSMGLSPLWKMPSVEVVYPNIPKYLKPVLMNLEGRAVSWFGVSEFKNKVFYTGLKLDVSNLQSEDFFKSLMGGLKSVLSDKNVRSDELIALPEASNFRLITLAKGFKNANILEYFSPEYCLILTQNGELYNCNGLSKELFPLGVFEQLLGAVDITTDPEVASNGYFYFYFGEEKTTVKRIKMSGSSKAEMDDFALESSLPVRNVFISKADSSNVGMPLYYQDKQFRLSGLGQVEVASLNSSQEVIDVEPFVLSFDKTPPNGIAQKENGEMMVLMKDSLGLLQYRSEKNFPPLASFSFKNLSLKPPFKVEFEANVEEGFEFEWEILGKKLVGRKITQVFKTAGSFPIKLRAFNGKQEDFILKIIKIEKALTVK